MGRTTKPGEPPDMRTLDDPEPPQPGWGAIEGVSWRRAQAIAKEQNERPRSSACDALRIGDWVIHPRRPNAWRRFWTWALLGWKWEKIE